MGFLQELWQWVFALTIAIAGFGLFQAVREFSQKNIPSAARAVFQPQTSAQERAEQSRERPASGFEDKSREAIAGAHSGAAFLRQGDLDSAESTLRKALEIAEQLGITEQQAAIAGNLGIVYQLRKNMVQACAHWRRARDLWRQIGDEGEIAKYECWVRAVGCRGEDGERGTPVSGRS